jgi:hypothetical protein
MVNPPRSPRDPVTIAFPSAPAVVQFRQWATRRDHLFRIAAPAGAGMATRGREHALYEAFADPRRR